MINKIKIAEKNIRLDCIHDHTKYMCHKFESNDVNTDFEITIDQKDVDFERVQNSENENPLTGENGIYGDAYLEFLAVHRKIAEHMLSYNTFMMHGSVVAVNDSAYMFTALSGVGKTTHTRLWLKNITGAFVVNGDKPLIKITNNQAIAYGTPWAGKEGFVTNCGVPLKAICILERGKENSIQEISFSEAFSDLYRQSYRPYNQEKMIKTLSLIEKLGDCVKFYKMHCNMKAEAAIMSYEAMSGEKW